MSYNPLIHHRRSIRLKDFDYSQEGLYFITMVCEGRTHRFGKIENGKMILNQCGQIAYDEWIKLLNRFPNFEMDEFQIMPNHVHGIISLKDYFFEIETTVGATLAVALPTAQADKLQPPETRKDIDENRATARVAPTKVAPTKVAPKATISDIIGAYKSIVSNGCLSIYKSKNKTMGKLWQRNYWEHIIRNQQAYQNISNYIINNPKKWEEDKFNGK